MEQSNKQKNYQTQLLNVVKAQVKKFLNSDKHRRVDRVHEFPMAPMDYFCQAMSENGFTHVSTEMGDANTSFKYVFTRDESVYHVTGSILIGKYRMWFVK